MHLNRALLVCALLSFFDVTCKEEDKFFQKSWLDKMHEHFAQSKFMDSYNQYWARECEHLYKGEYQDACEELKELGRKAQALVGISQERMVPIKQKVLSKGTYAHAGPGFIAINPEYSSMKYGAILSGLCHEAVHIKYRESETYLLAVNLSALSGMTLAALGIMYKAKGWWKLLCPVGAVFARDILGKFSAICYEKYCCNYFERRADVEGFYATKCYQCVTEMAEKKNESYLRCARAVVNNNVSTDENLTDGERNVCVALKFRMDELSTLTNDERESKALTVLDSMARSNGKGYLSVFETKQIADDLRGEAKLCDIHKE